MVRAESVPGSQIPNHPGATVNHRRSTRIRSHTLGRRAAAALALTLAAFPGTAYAAGRLTLIPSTHAPLGLPGFGTIVPYDAAQSVFVSSGSTGSTVEEVGDDGTLEGTVQHEYGADGMVLSADGATLYVALATGDAVAAIDTATFTEKARYPMPPHTCPTNLARTGPDVWIGYGCGGGSNAGVGVLATDAASPKIALGKQNTKTDVHYAEAPLLAAADGPQGTLAVSQPYLSPTSLALYAAKAGAAPALTLLRSAPRSSSELADLALSPDAGTVFAAAGSQATVDAYTASGLAGAGQYVTGLGPDAEAISPDGTQLAATTSIPDSHVYVWKLGTSTPVGDYWMPLTGAPAPRGLAFSGDGRILFLVTEPPSGNGGPTLVVLHIE